MTGSLQPYPDPVAAHSSQVDKVYIYGWIHFKIIHVIERIRTVVAGKLDS